MSRVINISIDVKMIDKEKIKVNANGSHYYSMSVMERKTPDDYGNTHYVVESQTKDERAAKAPKNYLKSSGKEFVFGDQSQVASNDVSQDDDGDDLPF
tara:strand:+ start:407 stop:700 length:294 start_codon:yes stop_codon:yes gene_type:complete